jgi:hypothetical protein
MKFLNTLFFAPKAIRTAERLDVELANWEYIGTGMIRSCYRVPGQLVCVKFYRTTEKADRDWKWDTYWRVRLTRHLFWTNINMQEWRYYERLKKRLPPDLMAVFPDTIEPIYSNKLGWGLRETLLINYDGSPVRSLAKEMKRCTDDTHKEALYFRASELIDKLVHHCVAIHDPQNILIQWVSPQQYQLRIVDFEPRTKAIIPGLTYIKPFIRNRVKNRGARFLMSLRQDHDAEPR